MINEYTDEGVINLAIAILEDARDDYKAHLNVCNDLQARISAKTDSKGIVGSIVEYITGDREFMLKEVEKEIRRRYKRG